MRQEIEIVRGTSKTLNISLKDANGGAYTLGSGEKLVFGVKEKPEDEALLIQKTVTASTNGICTVELIPEDTIGLKYGRLCYDVGLQSGEDYFSVIETSPFVVLPNVTKWGDGS